MPRLCVVGFVLLLVSCTMPVEVPKEGPPGPAGPQGEPGPPGTGPASGGLRQIRRANAGNTVSTTANAWADVPDMAIDVTTNAGQLWVSFSAFGAVCDGGLANYRLVIDGVPLTGTYLQAATPGTCYYANAFIQWAEPVAAGAHQVRIEWKNETAVGAIYSGYGGDDRKLGRTLLVTEVAPELP